MDDLNTLALIGTPLLTLGAVWALFGNIKASIRDGLVTRLEMELSEKDTLKAANEELKGEIDRLSKWIGENHKETTRDIKKNDRETNESIRRIYEHLINQ